MRCEICGVLILRGHTLCRACYLKEIARRTALVRVMFRHRGSQQCPQATFRFNLKPIEQLTAAPHSPFGSFGR